MAKKTVKKPAAHGKPSRSAHPSRKGQKKSAGLMTKVIGKPAKKLAKAVEKPAAKAPARISAPKAAPAKTSATKLSSAKVSPTKATAKAPGNKVSAEPQFAAKRMEKGKAERPAKAPAVAARNGSPSPAFPPPAPIIGQALSSNGKPRKNLAGFSSRELEHFRDLLLTKRRELIGDMSSMEREALRVGGGSNLSNLPIHMADMGTDNYEQEFTLGLVQKERDLLKEINLALAKIQNGTYGLCEGTQQPILKERLEYQPWARFSVEHQRKMERHGR